MSSVHGKVAVVTGAASGIGRALALELAHRGARLAVSDVAEAGLAETAALIAAAGAQVHSARLDVSDRAAFEAYAADVAGHYGVVHQLYGNAGIGDGGRPVLDTSWEDVDRTLAVNLFGVLNGTKAFLPHLVASGDGHVVTVSSLNGIAAQPSLAAYCTSKFAVRGFTEALRAEMLVAGHPVKVTVVHPGGVRTGIASAGLQAARAQGLPVAPEQAARARVYDEKFLRMPAAQAARIVVDGVVAGRSRVLVGNDARAADLLVRLAPRLYPVLAARFERHFFPAR